MISTLYGTILLIHLIRTCCYKQLLRTENVHQFNNSSVFYVFLFDVKFPDDDMKKTELYVKVYFEYLCICWC
jgi:hypothetical protein